MPASRLYVLLTGVLTSVFLVASAAGSVSTSASPHAASVGVVIEAATPRLPESFAAETQHLYARRDVAALRRLCIGATGEADLLCRYRLFPLTQDEGFIARLPLVPPAPTARAAALLSGLWGYRAARAPIVRMPAYGGRSLDLLRLARRLGPTDPFVLLVEGQSLLFRPALAGGDRRAALGRFRALQTALARAPADGISAMEADLWVWYTLYRMGDRSAESLHDRLLARTPPPLYRDFLLHPPRG